MLRFKNLFFRPKNRDQNGYELQDTTLGTHVSSTLYLESKERPTYAAALQAAFNDYLKIDFTKTISKHGPEGQLRANRLMQLISIISDDPAATEANKNAALQTLVVLALRNLRGSTLKDKISEHLREISKPEQEISVMKEKDLASFSPAFHDYLNGKFSYKNIDSDVQEIFKSFLKDCRSIEPPVLKQFIENHQREVQEDKKHQMRSFISLHSMK